MAINLSNTTFKFDSKFKIYIKYKINSSINIFNNAPFLNSLYIRGLVP